MAAATNEEASPSADGQTPPDGGASKDTENTSSPTY